MYDFLAASYDIVPASLQPAARGLVAETFTAHNSLQQHLFIKITRKPFFKCRLPQSAPAHAALAAVVGPLVNQPVPTRSGAWVASHGDALVTVSRYVDAPNREDYDIATFATAIATIHQATPRIQVPMARVTRFEHDAVLTQLMNRAYAGGTANWQYNLWEGLGHRRDQFEGYYERLCALQRAYSQHANHPWVVTHGDAGGNVINNTPYDLTIVDWDYTALAHPERDLWVFQHDRIFLDAYAHATGGYRPDPYHLLLAAYRQFFDYVVFILSDMFLQPPDVDRTPMIANLMSLCDGWITPHLR